MTKIDPIAKFSDNLFLGIVQLIEQAKHKVAVYLNTETTLSKSGHSSRIWGKDTCDTVATINESLRQRL